MAHFIKSEASQSAVKSCIASNQRVNSSWQRIPHHAVQGQQKKRGQLQRNVPQKFSRCLNFRPKTWQPKTARPRGKSPQAVRCPRCGGSRRHFPRNKTRVVATNPHSCLACPRPAQGRVAMNIQLARVRFPRAARRRGICLAARDN